LGFYLTGHPLERYRQILSMVARTTTAGLNSVGEGSEVSLAGVITRIKVTTTKRGNERMAILTLEDFEGNIEVLVFPKVFAHVEGHLRADAVVWISGRASLREDRPKLLGQEVVPLEDLFTRMTQSIRIRISQPVDRPVLEALKQTLQAHPGQVPVELAVGNGSNGGRRVAVGSTLNVTPSLELFKALIQLVGQEAISVNRAQALSRAPAPA
jgi:DNA polymerase-3 subunit alpha